jgi:xylulokinase
MSLLGIDVGTTGCKAAAFSVDGRSLATAYREYATLAPRPNWAELDSQEVMDSVRQVISEAASKTGKDPITALCVSTIGEAMTPVSKDRRILGNSILSVDLRGAEHVERLRQDIGQEEFYEINPNILAPNYSLPKLLWLRDHEPAQYKSAWKYLLWGDLAGFMLGGEPVTSFSHANRTLLFDIHQEDWSDQLLEWAGIDRDLLPETAVSGTVVGQVDDKTAEELGLQPGVKIVTGGHDQCCNSLGAGVYTAGKAVCGIGTVECIAPVYDRIPDASEMLPIHLNVEHQVLPGLYISFIYNQSGALIRWFRDTFASAEKELLTEGEDIYVRLCGEMPAEPVNLLVLPHFEITGAPDFITDSSGVIAGLRTSTSRGEILKAIMQGATFYFMNSLDALKQLGIDTSTFVATGGGAKSDDFLQIKADILGVPFERPKITECGVLGSAILAGLATGEYSSPKEGVDAFVSIERTFEPDLKRHEEYREIYERYSKLYPALQDILRTL